MHVLKHLEKEKKRRSHYEIGITLQVQKYFVDSGPKEDKYATNGKCAFDQYLARVARVDRHFGLHRA